MPQTQKAEVRNRILVAAEHEFYELGFERATLAGIARRAGTATANLYRYVDDKASLFEAVITDEFVDRFDRLLAARIAALAHPGDDGRASAELLEFWLANRRAVATLLDHTGPTRRGTYPRHFVEQLVDHFELRLGRPMSTDERALTSIVFDNTRRAIVSVLRLGLDDEATAELVRGFWSYQVPGLDSLRAWMAARSGHPLDGQGGSSPTTPSTASRSRSAWPV